MAVKVELERFATTTSIKGVGRTLKSSSRCLRVIWGLAVVCGISTSVYQCTLLLTDYFLYDTVVQLTELNLHDYASVEGAATIPDVTVCNINVFKRDREGYPLLEKYLEDVVNYTTCSNCSQKFQGYVDKLRSELISLAGYYQNVGQETAITLSHSIDEFIPRCLLLSFDGYTTKQRDCSTVPVIITRFPNPKYFNCFHFSTNGTGVDDTGVLVGFTFVLQLSNSPHQSYSEYFDPLRSDHSSAGAIVLTHQPNSWPWLERRPIYVAPGTHTNIKIRLEERVRMRSPYGQCHPGKYLRMSPIPSITYTSKACASICAEVDIMQDCGCFDASTMHVMSAGANQDSLPFCATMDAPLEEVVERHQCAGRRRRLRTDCELACHDPCREMKYHPQSSQSQWPSDPLSSTFYDSFIKDMVYEDRYADAYHMALEDMANFTARQRATELIGSNFVKVKVEQGYTKLTRLEDSVKMTGMTILSSVGAALNLWSGITVLLLIELVELGVRLLSCCSKSSPKVVQVNEDVEKTKL